jgi:D-serine deaminase-like pyridoxal phosphate-dependent protein
VSGGYSPAAVAELSRLPIPIEAKGFCGIPPGAPCTGAALKADGVTLFDGRLGFPLLTVRDSAVSHNIEQLARFTADQGVQFAPHAKTTMAPQLFARQLEAGAWGLTAATISQVMVYRRFGVSRVLLANELVDPGAITWLAQEMRADPGFEFHCYVDSLAGVELLEAALGPLHAAADPAPPRLSVLVELGFPGGRTGCRTLETALAVATAAAGTATLQVTGVAGYEGGLGSTRDEATLGAVQGWGRQLVELLVRLRSAGLVTGPGLISAGGSAFPDVIGQVLAQRPAGCLALLRSGSYLTHDDGMYAQLSPFRADGACPQYALRPALELWARVLSAPEPCLALLDLGRRDVGFDHSMPIPKRIRRRGGRVEDVDGLLVTRLNDQHAYLQVPPALALAPGDLVGLGISHPCTTLDRWQHPVLLDDDDRVLDVLTTFF